MCSYPDCGLPTFAAAQDSDRAIDIGVAAHITAASPGGPRFDPNLSVIQRSDQSNGIWLCQTHAKLIDANPEHFSVEMLRKWKRAAEDRSFAALAALGGPVSGGPVISLVASSISTSEAFGFIRVISGSDIVAAARSDLSLFTRGASWPQQPVDLLLRLIDGSNQRQFTATGLATAVSTFNRITVIAPPGTGKTTTLLQLARSILEIGEQAAVYVPLSELAARSDDIFESLARRRSFGDLSISDIQAAAADGRLVLLLDGWNELPDASRARVSTMLKSLEREYPAVGLIVSTRREALDIPIRGPILQIEPLNRQQQLQLALSIDPSHGATNLEAVIRTAGVRDLARIPLYLSALMRQKQIGVTREEVLRKFVAVHDSDSTNAAVLRDALSGSHTAILQGLASDATEKERTLLTEAEARTAITGIVERLRAAGQVSSMPESAKILDILVERHVLVRSGEHGSYAFQHQQFQEWFASLSVEATLDAAARGSTGDVTRFREAMVDIPFWEEPILFACERLSRVGEEELKLAVLAVKEAITIDPILAAEMIFRSSEQLWERVKIQVTAFVLQWYREGAFRAINFAFTCNKPEFADLIWPLISNSDRHIQHDVLRAGRRFNAELMGPDGRHRLSQMSADVRSDILSELAMRGGLAGIEFSTSVAATDGSAKVQTRVAEILVFRNAEAQLHTLLQSCGGEVWDKFAQNGYYRELTNQADIDRLKSIARAKVDAETEPLRKIQMLLALDENLSESKLEEHLNRVDMGRGDQGTRWLLDQAYKRYPTLVARMLVARLMGGQSDFYGAGAYLEGSGIVVDSQQFMEFLLAPGGYRHGKSALAHVAGSNVVRRCMADILEVADRLAEPTERANRELGQNLMDLQSLISSFPTDAFVAAVTEHGRETDPGHISTLLGLIARHTGHPGTSEDLRRYGPEHQAPLSEIVARWADLLVNDPTVERSKLAEAASAIGALRCEVTLNKLALLLKADLDRWYQARQQLQSAASAGQPIQRTSDVVYSFVNAYEAAFVAIGGDVAAEILLPFLNDQLFGASAARALTRIYKDQSGDHRPHPRVLVHLADLEDARVKRKADKARGTKSPYADAIFAAAQTASASADPNVKRLAIQLCIQVVRAPFGDRDDEIRAILELDHSAGELLALFAALTESGELVEADALLRGFTKFLDEAQTNSWLLRDDTWYVPKWLSLIAVSSQPVKLLDAMDRVGQQYTRPWQMGLVMDALGNSAAPESVDILFELAKRDPRFVQQTPWSNAFYRGDVGQRAMRLLDALLTGAIDSSSGAFQMPDVERLVVAGARVSRNLRDYIYSLYENGDPRIPQATLESLIVECCDVEGVLLLVDRYTSADRLLDHALRKAVNRQVVHQVPAGDRINVFEIVTRSVSDLRRELFARIPQVRPMASVPADCLTYIDELFDEYGLPDSERRHPNIRSLLPWPMIHIM